MLPVEKSGMSVRSTAHYSALREVGFPVRAGGGAPRAIRFFVQDRGVRILGRISSPESRSMEPCLPEFDGLF